MKKIKIEKESLKAIISAEWWIFLLIPLVISGTFFYLFYLMDKPKDNEKIRIFSGFEITEKFNKKIYNEYLDEFKDYGILETSSYWLDESTSLYALNFGNTIFNNYEVIISSQQEYQLNQGLYNNLCLSLDKNYYSTDLEFLYFEDKPIAVKIYDESNIEYNKKFTFETNINLYKTTFAFASSASINAQKKVDESHTLNEYALSKFLKIQGV